MELVINVPDDFYERMIEENGMNYIDAEVVVDAFYKATPLPKEHGELIDRDNLLRTLNEEHIEYDSDVNYFICHAPVIVEADERGD